MKPFSFFEISGSWTGGWVNSLDRHGRSVATVDNEFYGSISWSGGLALALAFRGNAYKSKTGAR